MQKNGLVRKIMLFPKFLVSHPGKQNIEMHILTIRQWNLIVYKNTDEWHIEWPQVRTSDSKKRMVKSDTKMTANKSNSKIVILSYKMKQKDNQMHREFYVFWCVRFRGEKYLLIATKPRKRRKHQEVKWWEIVGPFQTFSPFSMKGSLNFLVQNYWKIALSEQKWPTYLTYKHTAIL